MAVMALPPPDEEFVRRVLQVYDQGVASDRREFLSDQERIVDDWLISIEAIATLEVAVQRVLPGFVTLALGVEGESPIDARPVATAFVLPGLYPDGMPEPQHLEVRGEAGSLPVEMRVEPWAPRLHANLRDGTATCWVHIEDDRHALLTARHVVGVDRGTAFASLDDGGQAFLLWDSPNCLDASVLEAPEPPRPRFAYLNVDGPREFARVEVHTKNGPASREIKALNKTFGSYVSRAAHLFWLDAPLQAGDSGSLVTDDEGRAIGMYVGEHDTPQHGPLGMCQGLKQLDQLFREEEGTGGLCLPDGPGNHE
jgi:hypothetical protein